MICTYYIFQSCGRIFFWITFHCSPNLPASTHKTPSGNVFRWFGFTVSCLRWGSAGISPRQWESHQVLFHRWNNLSGRIVTHIISHCNQSSATACTTPPPAHSNSRVSGQLVSHFPPFDRSVIVIVRVRHIRRLFSAHPEPPPSPPW